MDLKAMLNADSAVDADHGRRSGASTTASAGATAGAERRDSANGDSTPAQKESESEIDAYGRIRREASLQQDDVEQSSGTSRKRDAGEFDSPEPKRLSTDVRARNGGANERADGDRADVTRDTPDDDRKEAASSAQTQTQTQAQAQSQSQQIAAPLRPSLEPSYTSRPVLDDMSRQIGDFIKYYLAVDPNWQGKSGIEIEAKLGMLLAKDTGDPSVRPGSRFAIPHIISAAILEQGEPRDLPFVFTSSMTEHQHRHFNGHLNREVEVSNTKPRTRQPLAYRHLYQTDTTYERPSRRGGAGSSGGVEKIRITRDDRSKEVIACICKRSVAQLNVTFPDRPFDVRISINHEEDRRPPPSRQELDDAYSGWVVKSIRRKDRVSYTHQFVQIDLTQVFVAGGGGGGGGGRDSGGGGAGGEKVHELEVECCNMAEWAKAAIAHADGRASKFEDLVRQFCGSIASLNQVAAAHQQQQSQQSQ